MMFSIYCGILFFTLNSTVYLKKRKLFLSNFYFLPSSLIKQCLSEHLVVRARTVAAVEISDRKDLNTLYKFRNLISVNRIFIKDYKVSKVSI
jgi:hypothetical protein